MGDITQEEIDEIHRVMAGENSRPEENIESEQEAYKSAIKEIQRQELNKRNESYTQNERDALKPVLNGQIEFNLQGAVSTYSELYSDVLDSLEQPDGFEDTLEDFSRHKMMAIAETPQGDEVVMSENRSEVRKPKALAYRARDSAFEVDNSTLKEIDYREEDLNVRRLRNMVLETEKRIRNGYRKLAEKGVPTPAPPTINEKLGANYNVLGFRYRG